MTEQFNPVLEDISINNKNPVLADMSSNEPSLWKDVVVKTGKDIVKSLAPIEGLVSWPGAPYRVIKKTLEGGSTLSAVGEEISKPVFSALEIIQPAANIAYTPAVITQEAVKNMVRKARGKELTSETGLGDVGKLFKGEERTGIVEDIRGKKFESPFVQGLVEGAESFIDPLLGFGTIGQIIAKNIPANFSKFVSKEMAADLEKITAHEKAVGSRLSSLEKAARERVVKKKLAFFEGITKAETANKSPLYDIPTEPEVFGKPEKIPYSVRAARAKKAGVSIEDIPKFDEPKPIGQKLYGVNKGTGIGRRLGETPDEYIKEVPRIEEGTLPQPTPKPLEPLAGEARKAVSKYELEIRDLKEQVNIGEAGKRTLNAKGEPVVTQSTYPSWMQNKGWTKQEVLGAIDKGLEGKPLGVKQQEIFNAVKQEARNQYAESVKLAQEKTIRDISTGELEVGDKVRVKGETLKVTEKTPEKIIIEDGQKFELDPYFDKITGKKLTPTKTTLPISKSAEELLNENLIRPKSHGYGVGRRWEYRAKDGMFTVAQDKETAIRKANEALQAKAKPEGVKGGGKIGETKLYSGMPIDFEKFIELADKAGKKVDDYLSGIGVSPESISIIMSNLGRTAKEVAKREERGGLKPLGMMEAKRLGGEGLAAKPITSESILDKPPIESSMDTRNFVKESVEAEKKAVTEADAISAKRSRIREVEKRAISSAGRVLERETPAGKEMVGLVNKTYKAGERLGGQFAADSKLNTKGLSKAEKENLVEVLEGGKPINDKVAQVAIKERDLYNQVAKLAGETDMTVLHPTVRKWTITGERGAWSLNDERGNVLQTFSRKADAEATLNSYLNTPFHIRENYFPRMVKRDVLEKRINEAIEHLIDTGQIEKADRATGALLSRDAQRELARSKINIYMRRNSERRYGNLQISRELDLPKWAYETNYDIVAPAYFEKAGMRIVQAKNWGAKDEKLRDLAQLIQEQGGDHQQATRLLDRILHKEVFDEGADTILAAVTGYNVKTKMGLSQIAQVGQRLSALYRTNAGSFYKAIKSIHQNPEAEADYFLRIGAGLRGVSQAARQQMAGSTTTEGFLKYTGFTRQDLKSRLIAGVTGRFYAEHLADKLVKTEIGSFGNNFARRRLEQLDLNPDEILARGGKLTEEERIIAGQKGEIDTNFRNRILDLPEFWTSRWGKVITQFKSFSYAQTKMLRDYVVKEAMHGNPLPMVSLLVAGQISGEVINDVRSLITGKDRPKNIPQRVLENYAVAGATGVFEMIFSTIKYADSQFGATLTTIKEGVKAGASAIKGEFKEAAEFAAAQIPVAGQRARREVQKLMESEATKKKKEREDKYWEKHPWSPRGVFPGTPPKKSESSGGYSSYGGY